MTPLKISVIIPTLNEASVLEKTLRTIRQYNPYEIIIGDGGSDDATVEIAKKFSIFIVNSFPGRALQMNAAAKLAKGEILLFLHADSIMESEGYGKMVGILTQTSIVGGAFSLRIRSARWSLQLISWFATLRSKYLRIVYGDQAIFVRKKIFKNIGGFPSLPICEDMEFFNRLKKEGKTVILDEKAFTSPRKWHAQGVAYTTFKNWLITCLFILGFSPKALSKWYFINREPKQSKMKA